MPPEETNNSPRQRMQLTPSRAVVRFVRRHSFWLGILLLIIVAVGSLALGRYSVYWQHPGLSQQDEAKAIIAKVGQLIQLPQNEAPTMAKVTNAAAVKEIQPFLANAQNGDVLIVYSNAKTALLYRPSTDKLIAVGPVTAQTGGPSSATETISPSTSTKATNASSSDATTTSSKK